MLTLAPPAPTPTRVSQTPPIRGILRPMTGEDPQDVDLILNAVGAGDRDAADQLMRMAYPELRRLAESYMKAERPDHTLDATGVVHEAFLRLLRMPGASWESRDHFFNAVAQAMRRLLIDHSRAHRAAKRGGDRSRVNLETIDLPITQHVSLDQAEMLNDLLDELANQDPVAAKTLQYREMLGMSVDDTAEALGVSATTVKSNRRFALSFLRARLESAAS